MNIAVYISGHGFGHLAQLAPVLNSIFHLRPDCRFLIRCALAETELRARFDFPFELDAEAVDVGVIQKNAIEEEREASIALLADWLSTMDTQLEREIEILKSFAPDLVLSNISPLAFPAAKALAVPGVALATLDWFTIYSHWLEADDPLLVQLKAAYAACDLLLSPPMAMAMPVFSHQQTIPLLAAHSSAVPFKAGMAGKKIALVIFGGTRQPPFALQALGSMQEWLFLLPDAPDNAPANVQAVHFDKHLKPVDLMPFVDVVLCKPGYGILAECWQSRTPIAWVERPDFPEFPVLKQWLEHVFPSAGMDGETFRKGEWSETLEAALHCSRAFPKLEHDGAKVAAQLLINYAATKKCQATDSSEESDYAHL